MNIYYALGLGIEALYRAEAFIHSLHLQQQQWTILVEADIAQEFKFGEKCRIANKNEALSFFHERKDQVENVYVDNFAGGFYGELSSLGDLGFTFHYVVSYLEWDEYKTRLKDFNLKYHTSFTIEEQHPEQNFFILQHSKRFERIRLHFPEYHKNTSLEGFDEEAVDYILLSHPGNEAEVMKLLEIAANKANELKIDTIVVLSNTQLPETYKSKTIISSSYYPALYLFDKASSIVTACGFLEMQWTKPYRHKHIFMPFTYPYEDQNHRAEVRRDALLHHDYTRYAK